MRTLMNGRGMGSFCSTTSSVISSVSRVKALSATCAARSIRVQPDTRSLSFCRPELKSMPWTQGHPDTIKQFAAD